MFKGTLAAVPDATLNQCLTYALEAACNAVIRLVHLRIALKFFHLRCKVGLSNKQHCHNLSPKLSAVISTIHTDRQWKHCMTPTARHFWSEWRTRGNANCRILGCSSSSHFQYQLPLIVIVFTTQCNLWSDIPLNTQTQPSLFVMSGTR